MTTQVTEKKNIFEYEFHLKKIRATNFRLFSEVEIELHPKLNVLIGVNGAGKTTILDIISKMLLFFIKSLRNERLKEKEVIGTIFQNSDIKENTFSVNCSIESMINSCMKDLSEESIIEQEDFSFSGLIEETFIPSELNWNSSFEKDNFKGIDFSNETLLDLLIRVIQKQIQTNQIVRLPILLYINSDTNFNEAHSTNDFISKPTILNGYDFSMDNTNGDFDFFEKWFKWQEMIEIQTKSNNGYNHVSHAICSILSDGNHLFKNIKTNWLDNPVGELVIEKNNETIKINQLSSGEKRVMEIAARIAYKLAIANPGKSNVLEGSGVVLIDEIDLHLHPQWQRKIIPQLQKTFPNIQFVVTTHSPLVIQNVEKENVKILEDGKLIEEVPLVFGRDTNTVLYEVFGTEERPQDIQRLIDECFLLLEDDNIEKGKEKLLELSKIIGENDKEIIRANSYLKFISE